MAIKPQDGDTFFREVDEELRRERVGNFITRFGKWLIGGVVLILAAVGGFIYWEHRQTQASGEMSDRLSSVMDQIEQNNARGAAEGIDQLVASNVVGYRMAGLFSRANAQIATGAIPAAILTLQQIADDPEAPQPYKDAAIIRRTQLEYDRLTPAQVLQRLQPYAVAGNPWFGTAGELVGLAYIHQGRYDQAAQIFGNIGRDTTVPDSIRQRAIQMASSLGVDAVEIDPTIGQPDPAPPAPPPGAAPPAAAQRQGNAAAPAPAQGNGAAPARPAAPAPAGRPAGNSQ